MPHVILKRVWDYCTYNYYFLAFIFVLLFISSLIQNYVWVYGTSMEWFALNILVFISVSGYGMSITRSRINHGKRLPKIEIKDIVVLGIKSLIVLSIFVFVQQLILVYVSDSLNFPVFDLEEILLHWLDTIRMLYYSEPVNTVLFVSLGTILFYVSSFFTEIALAILADTGSLLEAFNLKKIKRSIDVIGWTTYTREFTLIILAIVILSYLVSIDLPITFIDSLIDMVLSFFIFVTQYLGIGAIYCRIKDLQYDRQKRESSENTNFC